MNKFIVYLLIWILITGNWHDRLKDKFLGMTLQLKTPSLLANSSDRFELLTETVGTVTIKLQIIAKNFGKFGCLLWRVKNYKIFQN